MKKLKCQFRKLYNEKPNRKKAQPLSKLTEKVKPKSYSGRCGSEHRQRKSPAHGTRCLVTVTQQNTADLYISIRKPVHKCFTSHVHVKVIKHYMVSLTKLSKTRSLNLVLSCYFHEMCVFVHSWIEHIKGKEDHMVDADCDIQKKTMNLNQRTLEQSCFNLVQTNWI